MEWMLRNSEGKKDATLTLTVVGFLVILLKLLLSNVTVGPLTFGELDSGLVAALLTPTLGSYVARRYTDLKHGPVTEAVPSDPEEREGA